MWVLSLGMQRHAIAVAIVPQAFQIGAVIRIVMEDGCAAILEGEEMITPAGDVEAWLAGHGGGRSGWCSNQSMLMPDPNYLFRLPHSRAKKTSIARAHAA
jgi:hypothetical protein